MADSLLSLCTTAAWPALPENWPLTWSLAPATVLPLALLLVLGLRHMARTGATAAQRRLWLGGWAVLAAALVSPLCRLGATLVAGHMAQLMLIATLAGALLAAGSRRPAVPAPTGAAALCYGAVLWLWHLPPVYTLTLADPTAHVLAYGALAAASWWFWHAVRGSAGLPAAGAVPVLLFTLAHTGLLGALLTFAARPYYPVQAGGATAWGLAPLEDQQLAGLLMWVPGGIAYGGAALATAMRWLETPTDTAAA